MTDQPTREVQPNQDQLREAADICHRQSDGDDDVLPIAFALAGRDAELAALRDRIAALEGERDVLRASDGIEWPTPNFPVASGPRAGQIQRAVEADEPSQFTPVPEPTERALERATDLVIAWHEVARQGWESQNSERGINDCPKHGPAVGPDEIDLDELARRIALALDAFGATQESERLRATLAARAAQIAALVGALQGVRIVMAHGYDDDAVAAMIDTIDRTLALTPADPLGEK
jgi:hypothetical protein